MDFLTNPFTAILLFLYNLLGQNIILAIVIFTVLVRVVTYPLMASQLKSSKRMQELTPRLNKLKEKYKGDREKLAQEQMKLYKDYGINPLAGCLPLLVQMPILFGLYGAIMHALANNPLQVLDLHHRIPASLATLFPIQNQFLWLNLAQPDPTPVLPILVVATTWLQQKLMTPPSSGDPKDPSSAMSRQMLIMMPLMIGFFSLSFASGLSIYWVVGNVLTIIQYAMMGRVDLRKMSAKQAVVTPVTDGDDDVIIDSKPSTAKAAIQQRAVNSPNIPKTRPKVTPRKRSTGRAK